MLSNSSSTNKVTKEHDNDSLVPCKSTRICQNIKQDISSSIVTNQPDTKIPLLSLMNSSSSNSSSKEDALLDECETFSTHSTLHMEQLDNQNLTNNNEKKKEEEEEEIEINQFNISFSPNMSTTPSSLTSGGYLDAIPESEHEDDDHQHQHQHPILTNISHDDNIIHPNDNNVIATPSIQIDTSTRSRSHSHSYSLDIQLPVISLPIDSSVLTSLPDPRPFHVTHLQQGPAHDLFMAMNNVLDDHSYAQSKFYQLLLTERSDIPDAQWVKSIASLFADAPWLVESFLVVVGWCGSFDPLQLSTTSSPNLNLPSGSPMGLTSLSHSPPGTSPGWFANPTSISLVTPAIALDDDRHSSSSLSSSSMDPVCQTDGFDDFQLPTILRSPVPSPIPDPTLDHHSFDVTTTHCLLSSPTQHLSPNIHHSFSTRSPSPLRPLRNNNNNDDDDDNNNNNNNNDNKQWIAPELAYPFDHDSSRLHEEQDEVQLDDLNWEDIIVDKETDNHHRHHHHHHHHHHHKIKSLTPAKLISAYAEMTLGTPCHHPHHQVVTFHRHSDKKNTPKHDDS